MKLEYGKRYVAANGDVTGPLEPRSLHSHFDDPYPYWDPMYERSYTKTGTWSRSYPEDRRNLVAEYVETATVTESICDADQQQVRNTIIRRADEARITGFATAALTGMLGGWGTTPKTAIEYAWAAADAMEAEWQKRFGR